MSWKIFQNLFNLPPWDDAEYFTDKLGTKFWFAWGTHFDFGPKLWVYYCGKWVATIETAWNDEGGLDLCDIVIFEKSFRNRGLGKKCWICSLTRQTMKEQNSYGGLSRHMMDLLWKK